MTQPLVPAAQALPPDAETDSGAEELAPRSEDVVAFPDGLPGFESCRRFVVMSLSDAPPFQCLQGLDAPRPAFLTIDPTLVLRRYRLLLSPADRLRLDAREDDALLWMAVVTYGADETATVNLRAPLVINPRLMIGFQLMPHQSLYPLRHPLRAFCTPV
jgi:flagellar assembly factor FliW